MIWVPEKGPQQPQTETRCGHSPSSPSSPTPHVPSAGRHHKMLGRGVFDGLAQLFSVAKSAQQPFRVSMVVLWAMSHNY